MRILHVGVFTENSFDGDQILRKGFQKNGHEVFAFNYRNVSQEIGINKMNQNFVAMAEQCDLVFIGKGEQIDPAALAKIKAKKVLWYGDQRANLVPIIADLAKECDLFLHTTSGERLRQYHKWTNTTCAFFMIPCDHELYNLDKFVHSYIHDIMFSGGDYPQFSDNVRNDVLNYLDSRDDFTCYGRKGRPFIYGHDYSQAIVRSKIAVSVNNYNNYEKYNSERLMNYAAGTFVLSYAVPGIEKLWDNLETFSSIAELSYKLTYYLEANDEREAKREALIDETHNKYHYQDTCLHILNLLEIPRGSLKE